MQLSEITRILDEFIRDKFQIGNDPDYSAEINLFDYGFVDSAGATEILLYAEETFGVEITQKDLTLYPMNSVSEIAEVIYKKRGV